MDYQLTVRFSFQAMDDVEARSIGKDFYANPECFIEGVNGVDYTIKLQKIFKDKAPQKLSHGLYGEEKTKGGHKLL